MLQSSARQTAEEFQLRESIAHSQMVDRESVQLFGAVEKFLTELFKNLYRTQAQVITAAPTIPEIAIAADRAEFEMRAIYSMSPFAGEIESVTKALETGVEIVYLANPNRQTGATYSNLQIKQLAKSLSRGILIVDVYYHDFSGLTALPLLGMAPNLVILRSFENWQTGGRAECGYAILSEQLLERLDNSTLNFSMERALARKCLDTFTNKKATAEQVKQVQKQSLQMAGALSNLGVKSQICPTDFIVIQTDDAVSMRQALLAHQLDTDIVTTANNDSKYLLYRVFNNESNLKLEQAFMKIFSRKKDKRARPAVTV